MLLFLMVTLAVCVPVGFIVETTIRARHRPKPRAVPPRAPSHPVWAGASSVALARERYLQGKTTIEGFEAEVALAVYIEDEAPG